MVRVVLTGFRAKDRGVLDQPETIVKQAVADQPDLMWLRGRLSQQRVALGHEEVRLVATYNPQYRSVSIVCTGGTLEQQRALMAQLAKPLENKELMRQMSDTCHYREYATSTNPQINFNNFGDALRWMRAFDGIGPAIKAPESSWARA